MKKNIGLIILIIIMCVITSFLAYIVVSKQHVGQKDKFNLVKGDVIEFKEDNITATILNVASTLCDNKDTCIDPGEIEVSVRVEYNDNVSNYTLKTVNNPEERIVKSNYYIKLTYDNKELKLSIREK